jgi:signal transduction histidine kinase
MPGRERGFDDRKEARKGGPPPEFDGHGPGGPIDGGPGRWRLAVRHRAGSLEALVAQTRRRNLGISGAILLLILATVAMAVQFSRQREELARLQMNFVAGVSHELRTPLTVIRTAAFNLRGKLASRPDQVERYGALIQAESERLGNLVEQVLQFASSEAGHVIRSREAVAVSSLIEESIRSSRARLGGERPVIERHIDDNLPPVMADQMAMTHALQNLIDNALKYGTEASNWIGIFATAAGGREGSAVEIRIADRGPGIPVEEQERIFDPFFRGRRAIEDQVHGTGLGLNLVKKIVEAHGGTIRVQSRPMEGTEFVIRIPAAPPEYRDEFAHSAD